MQIAEGQCDHQGWNKYAWISVRKNFKFVEDAGWNQHFLTIEQLRISKFGYEKPINFSISFHHAEKNTSVRT